MSSTPFGFCCVYCEPYCSTLSILNQTYGDYNLNLLLFFLFHSGPFFYSHKGRDGSRPIADCVAGQMRWTVDSPEQMPEGM